MAFTLIDQKNYAKNVQNSLLKVLDILVCRLFASLLLRMSDSLMFMFLFKTSSVQGTKDTKNRVSIKLYVLMCLSAL